MRVFFNIIAITIGGIAGIFATDIGSNMIHKYRVYSFLEKSVFSLDSLKEPDWNTQDARIYLTKKLDESGKLSCTHVIPIQPEYQILTTLKDGSEVCCDLKPGPFYIPVSEKAGFTDYYCGLYPNQQIVRVFN